MNKITNRIDTATDPIFDAALAFFWERIVDETHAEYSGQPARWSRNRLAAISEYLYCNLCRMEGALMMIRDSRKKDELARVYLLAKRAREDADNFHAAWPKWVPMDMKEKW